MTKLTVLIGILSLLSVTEAQALSLSNIVQPYASNGAGTDWNTVMIKSTKWKNTSNDSGFSREATVNIDCLGRSNIRWTGPRTMVYNGEISANFSNNAPNLKTIVGPSGSVQKVRGKCPNEGSMYYSNVYKVTFSKTRPVYIQESISINPSSPGGTYDLYVSSDVSELKCS